MTPDFTPAEAVFIDAARRLGLRYGGAVRRFKGFTLLFHDGTVGDVRLHRVARSRMPGWVGRQVSKGRKHSR